MPAAERFWIAPAIVIAATSLAGIAAGSIAAVNHSDTVRLTPGLSGWLLLASFAVPIVGGVTGLVWLLRRWRRAQPAGSVRRRVLVAMSLALGFAGAAAAGTGIDLGSSLFDGSPVAESHSPGGRRAWVIPWAFMCGHELWLAEPGAFTMRRVDHVGTKCDTTPGIGWDGEQPHFTDVVPESINLYLGPH